ncbi:aminotransferase class III-fold pyridoxal phosphate-dependent enzyme [Pseudomonas veronii]|uniref:aminotransferase class III-fold pyridoxal phosphate-dependent enzyme n=1 Tax=Pseudomonas veronii TaxID=76761 RepID=UPI0021BF3167|nr:aminotransferase class III-fold pyridoxal phosphate-dependent enzyme [Pseudomonas veronii]MCT9826620.1 aminotransferase class III-fold pyridoxal phosphate-dependent enzyme [Pseudomonas veronii]
MQKTLVTQPGEILQNLQPPEVPLGILSTFAAEQFGLSGDWTPLVGERDQNFRVTDADGIQWVFRLCNPHENTSIFECQIKALEHLKRTDPSLPVPRVLKTLNGQSMKMLRWEGVDHCVIVLSFLPGEVIGTTQLTNEQLYLVGQLVARLGKALRGFNHPAPSSRYLAWDHRRLPELLHHVDILPEVERAKARQILGDFCENILPNIDRLRSQIIHGDAHPDNTLIHDGALSGIIDFGDMVFGALVQDLSNTIADFIFPGADNTRIIYEIVKGYQSVTPLEEEEIDVLLPLIETRLLMTPLIVSLRSSGGAAQASYADVSKRAFPLLSELEASRELISNAARRAAAFTQKNSALPSSFSEMLERRRKVMGNNLYMFYDSPLHLVKGEGVWLTASDGKRYLDCYNNVPHVGHCHPCVTGSISRQSHILNTNTRYLSEQSLSYAERLTSTLDRSLSAVVYVNSGSEANDVAWRMAKAWTGRAGGLAMEYAYHGITDAIDPFSPSNDLASWKFPHMRLIPAPDDYRGIYKRGEPNLAQRYADLADQPIEELSLSQFGVAAFMVDSAFMTNGMIEAPLGYLSRVVDKVRKAGGLFIADEVQSGFGRMGSAFWGHQHHGVIPDFVTIGKPAGNGHPIGIVITRPEILDHFTKTATFFSTFGGNNVSCAAGLAVLDVIRDEALVENAKATGAYFKARLLELKRKYTLIGDVRGTGLAIGVELVRDHNTLEPANTETKRLANLVRDQGVLIGTEGVHGNILKLRPPLVFEPHHVDIVISALDKAFGDL